VPYTFTTKVWYTLLEVHLLDENINRPSTKTRTKTILYVRKEVGLEENADITKCRQTFVSRHQNTGQNRNIKIANSIDTYFENMTEFNYLGTTVTNQNTFKKKSRAD
jgi:hypothetical protein